MSINHVRPWRTIERRRSRQIKVGNVAIGGDAPISVQTMTNTDTTDVKATLKQITSAAEAGADLVRVSVPDEASSGALKEIVDYPIHIQFDDMEICEDIQLSIFHYVKQRLISKYSEYFTNLDLPKYQKRTLEDLIS